MSDVIVIKIGSSTLVDGDGALRADVLSRRVAEKLRGSYAQNMLVENKPGAGGQIAITTLKTAPADGSTLLLTPSSMLSVYPFTYSKLPYTLDDLAPVSVACFFSLGFGVGPAVPASVTLAEPLLRTSSGAPFRPPTSTRVAPDARTSLRRGVV